MVSRVSTGMRWLGKTLHGHHVGQFLAYAISVAGTMLFSFVLVLVLVRILPSEAYGKFVLIKALLLVVISLAGLGLSQAAIRWGRLKEREGLVLGTVLSGAIFSAIPAAVLFIALIVILVDRFKLNVDLILVGCILILIPSYCLNNELINWLRAKHHAKRHAIVSTFRALLQMMTIIAGIFLADNSSGYLFGLAISELLLLLLLIYGYRDRLSFQGTLLGEMIKYGYPHTFVIASGFLLSYTDRYMLSFLTNNDSLVAFYDAASMVVVAAMALLVRPFNLYLFPAYIKCYEEGGLDPTVNLVNRAQRIFLISGLCVSTFIIVFRKPLMNLLFPENYSIASSIFVFVAYSNLLNGVFLATVAGLYISKKTMMVGVVAVMAVLLNVAANWLLIPVYGINGAAIGTVIASLAQLIFGYYCSKKILPVKLPIKLMVGGALWLVLVNYIVS